MTSPAGDNIRVLVVDDEPLARAALRRLLADEAGIEVVGEGADGAGALEPIRRLRPDLVFLDVKMPGMSGLDLVQRLGPTELPVIVFVTAFDEYAVAAFEAHALDYLMKPLTVPRFRAALARARTTIAREAALERHAQVLAVLQSLAANGPATPELRERPARRLDRFQVEVNHRIVWIDAADIDWIESDRNLVLLHVGSSTYQIRRTMGAIEQALDPARFVRIHRTAIVNRARIQEVRHDGHGEYHVRVGDGTELKLGRTFRHRLVHQPA